MSVAIAIEPVQAIFRERCVYPSLLRSEEYSIEISFIARNLFAGFISWLVPIDSITADDLREHVEYWVVGKRAHSTQIVHVPGPDSTPNGPQPACEHREHPTRGDSWSGWNVKSPSAYPPGYVSLCQDCARYATSGDATPEGTIDRTGDPPLKDP